GVCLPGRQRYSRVHATRDVLRWAPAREPRPPQSWQQLAGEVNRWKGRSAVLSQEFMCRMKPDQVQGIVQSFPHSSVRVVLTVRDVARLLPAQWQTQMRSRSTWKLAEYADAVAGVSEGPRARTMADHFWERHDYRPILERWAAVIGMDHIQVVTVPASGADPDELWRRFCQACELDATNSRPGEKSHESLGAVSAELMRRLNARPAVAEMSIRTYQKSVSDALTRKVLGHRRSVEPGLSLPEVHAEWAVRESTRLIADIEAVGVRVVGDLDDLRPRPGRKPAVAPEEIPDADLLEAALDGLAGLAAEHAKLVQRLSPGESGSHPRAEDPSVKPLPVSTARRVLSRVRATWRR
nr:hypothetical protein [Candidatus Nanopelagicales bacterium]